MRNKLMLRDLRLRRFLGVAGLASASRALAAVAAYVSVLFLARLLDQDTEFGQISFAIALIAFFSAVVNFGMPVAILRFLAQYTREGEQDGEKLRRGIIKKGTALVFWIAASVSLAGAAVSPILNSLVTDLSTGVLLASFFLLPPFALAEVQGAAARSEGRILLGILPRDVIWRFSFIPLGLLLAYVAPGSVTSTTLLLTFAAALYVIVYVQRVRLFRILPFPSRGPAEARYREWIKVGIPIGLGQISLAGLRSLDVIILSAFVPIEQVGWYFAASRTAGLIGFALITGSLVMGPEVARLYFDDDQDHLKKILRWGAALIFAPAVVGFLAIAFFSTPILKLFGEQFVAAEAQLLILAVGQVIRCSTGNVGTVLNILGHERIMSRILVQNFVFSLVAVTAGAWLYGATGAAIASTAGVALWNLRAWWTARKLTGLDPSIIGCLPGLQNRNPKV